MNYRSKGNEISDNDIRNRFNGYWLYSNTPRRQTKNQTKEQQIGSFVRKAAVTTTSEQIAVKAEVCGTKETLN